MLLRLWPFGRGLRHPMHRIPDWDTLDTAARERRQEHARPQATALDPILNAFAQIDATPFPLSAAGPLGGLPYAAKDLFQTLTHRPGGGFAEEVDLEIIGTSDLLERLDANGADLIGFTNMTELAYEPSGFNATRGRVRNPWKLDCISGGSSSGSAAAVASGAVVAALGSDTGGSVRIPAHACGITAWKPTHGVVSARGTLSLAPTLDTIGLLARSAADMMPLVRVMAELRSSQPVLRAAVLQDIVAQSDPAIRCAVADAAAVLAGAGISIEQRPALAAIEAIDRHAMIVMQGESARVHRARIDDAAVAPVLRRRLAKGLEIADATLAESVAARQRLVHDFEEQVLAGNDVAVLPVMAILTPSAAECDPASERFSPRTLYALSRFTRFVNMLGFPAIALPAGFDDRGLPIGVQIVGRTGCDLALFELVRHVQSKTDWHARIPTAIANILPEPELPS
jgi:aspartyl-tRNA(Asn)/glutamyl-tRNA(Gln) amidotransferase subunit A